MGIKIRKAFDAIIEVATISERMAVSMKAGIPSNSAGTVPDDAKNLGLMKQAITKVFDDLQNDQIKTKKQEILNLLK